MADKKLNYKKRLIGVLSVFLKIFFAFRKEMKFLRRYGYAQAQKRMEQIHYKRAKELYELAVELGGVMIKLCQYLSTRRDIFPEPYIKILSPLQDSVPPVDFKVIADRLNEELGDYSGIFQEIEETPLASASLGQVHKGRLFNGDIVVVKVLKPDAEKTVDLDFAILFQVFKLFSNFKSLRERFDFLTIFDEFVRVTGDELNFKREVYVSKFLRSKLAKFRYLKIPYVYEEFSTSKVIVMEFCEGTKITDVDNFRAMGNDPIVLARRIVEVYLEQFLFIKVIHFDPHPGNILVTSDNNIVLLDFGMSGEITEQMSDGIKNGIRALISRDYRGIIDILYGLGFIKKGVNRYSLLPVLEYFFDEIIETVNLDKQSIQSVDLSPVMDDLIEIIYSQPFNLPIEWAYLGRTTSTLAGIIAILNPKFKLYEEFKPFADRLLRGSISDIFDTGVEYIKKNARIAASLPSRIDFLLDSLDKGVMKFKVDFEEIDDRLDNLKVTVVKSVSFGVSIFCLVGAYIMYKAGYGNGFMYLGFAGILALVYSIFYHKKRSSLSRKSSLKKKILKK